MSTRWRKWLKIIATSIALVFVVFGITTWSLFRQRNKLVLDEIHAFVSTSQSGQLTIGSIDLALFRDFPDISIELDSIQYFEHWDSVRLAGEQPIFEANRVFVSLGLWSLVNNQVEVAEISVSDGSVHLVEYRPGVFNINRALTKPVAHKSKPVAPASPAPRTIQGDAPQKSAPVTKKTSEKSPAVQINLDYVLVENVRFSWQLLGEDEHNSVRIGKLESDLSHSPETIALEFSSRVNLDTVRFGSTRIPDGIVTLEATGQFNKTEQVLAVKEFALSLDFFTVTGSGTYAHAGGNVDVTVDASSNDLPLLEKLLRPETLRESRDILRGGDLYMNGKIFGALQRPQFDFTFGAKDLSFRVPGQPGIFRDLGFEGRLVSGTAADYSTGYLQLQKLKGTIPGGFIRGDVRLSNWRWPSLQCTVETQFDLKGYDKVFQLDRIHDVEGTVSASIQYDGPLQQRKAGPKARFNSRFSIDSLAFLVHGLQEGVRDVVVKGDFTSGELPDQSLARLNISTLSAVVPGGALSGKIKLENLVEPMLSYTFSAGLTVDGYDDLLGFKNIRDLRGNLMADLKFDGPLRLIGTHAMDSSRSSTIRLDSVSFRIGGKRISALQGSLVNQNNIAEVNLAVQCGGSDLELRGKAENLMHRIFGNERIVQATGSVRSKQFFTRDFIFDSLRTALVEDRIGNLSVDFTLRNSLAKDDTLLNRVEVQFDVKDLTARFDKLADILDLDARGFIRSDTTGVSIGLQQFDLTLPQGRASIAGTSRLPGRRQLDGQARVRLTNFPWVYVKDLVAEIKDGTAPGNKNLPVTEMERVTADLEVTTGLLTYPFDILKLNIRNSRIFYTDKDNKSYGADKIDATFAPFTFLHPRNSGALSGIRKADGTISLKGFKVPGIVGLDVGFNVNARNDSLMLQFTGVTRQAGGSLFLNLVPPSPTMHFHYDVRATPAEDIVKRFSPKKFLTGTIGYTVDASTTGNTWTEVRKNLSGTLDIRSDSLQLYGVDIDDVLTKFEKSQKFNLADLGAVVLVGPIGIVATKGSDFVALATVDVNNRKQSHIRQLLARWELNHQVLKTTDVAFATNKNRVAFDGSLDFDRDSIPGIRVAVVDKNGCSLMDQKLYGKFTDIKTGKLNIAKTLLGSVVNFVDALVGTDCQPVYTGEVKDPKVKQK